MLLIQAAMQPLKGCLEHGCKLQLQRFQPPLVGGNLQISGQRQAASKYSDKWCNH
jgi:hypothetical protein